jgi:hypothetical protein
MKRSRREFIGASAVIGVLGASEASAQQRGRARSTRARRHLLNDPRMIGIVHSTQWEAEFDDCFRKGLANGWNQSVNILQPKEIRGRYGGNQGHSQIENAVKQFATAGVDLIVAAGGRVSEGAAWTALTGADIPFVYLIGSEPSGGLTPDPQYCGLNLNTRQSYSDAVNVLGVANPENVYLIVNANADMAGDEIDYWKSINQNYYFKFFFHANNNYMNFQNQVMRFWANANPKPSGLVISSDPYFRWKAQDFAGAIKTLNIPRCYPFQTLVNADPVGKLLPNGAMLSSSDNTQIPNTAYYQLGLRAGAVLSAQSNSKMPSSQVASKTWNAATRAWV